MPTSRSLPTYDEWRETCDTLHAHTQVLGKLAAVLAPPEPQLQHAALRLTARGWETAALPAPDGSGVLVVSLDLHGHEAVVEHSDGRSQRVALTPDRAVGEVTRALLDNVRGLVGDFGIDLTPQEVDWKAPLDEDDEAAMPTGSGRLRERDAGSARGPLGGVTRRVRPGLGRRRVRRRGRSPRARADLRPVGVPAPVPRVRVGSRPRRHRGGPPTARPLTPVGAERGPRRSAQRVGRWRRRRCDARLTLVGGGRFDACSAARRPAACEVRPQRLGPRRRQLPQQHHVIALIVG